MECGGVVDALRAKALEALGRIAPFIALAGSARVLRAHLRQYRAQGRELILGGIALDYLDFRFKIK